LNPGAAQLSLLENGRGGLVVRKRLRANVPVYQTNLAAVTGSAWLRLERKGQTISLAQSADGSQWASIPGATIELPETAYAGLAVTSQRPDAMATASLSNVQLVSQSDLANGWVKADLDGTGFSSHAQYSSSAWTVAQWPTSTPSSGGVTYLYQRVSGDAEISVHVSGLSSAAAVAGVQIRSTLESDSPYLWLRTNSGGKRTTERRLAAGLPSTTSTVGSGAVQGWLKLVRLGSMVSAYQSQDGSSWTLLTTEAIDLSGEIYMGMALSRGSSSSAAAVFDDVHFEAVSANQPPTVSLTWPSAASSVIEGESLSISAEASDSDDRVEAVEFFVDGTRVGVDTAAPYQSSWLAAGAGPHEVTASARDSDGAIVQTPAVVVTVQARQDYENGGSSPAPRQSSPPRTPTNPSNGSTNLPPSPPAGTWRLVFVPSVDHDDLVDRYTAEIYSMSNWALVGARDLGRPVVLAGECNVDLSQWINALPAGQYEIIVRAVNDATNGQSPGASFSFVR
jgi:hypothetical protein